MPHGYPKDAIAGLLMRPFDAICIASLKGEAKHPHPDKGFPGGTIPDSMKQIHDFCQLKLWDQDLAEKHGFQLKVYDALRADGDWGVFDYMLESKECGWVALQVFTCGAMAKEKKAFVNVCRWDGPSTMNGRWEILQTHIATGLADLTDVLDLSLRQLWTNLADASLTDDVVYN
jgi:hypothetical protein